MKEKKQKKIENKVILSEFEKHVEHIRQQVLRIGKSWYSES
jgi:hypothetical protein